MGWCVQSCGCVYVRVCVGLCIRLLVQVILCAHVCKCMSMCLHAQMFCVCEPT